MIRESKEGAVIDPCGWTRAPASSWFASLPPAGGSRRCLTKLICSALHNTSDPHSGTLITLCSLRLCPMPDCLTR